MKYERFTPKRIFTINVRSDQIWWKVHKIKTKQKQCLCKIWGDKRKEIMVFSEVAYERTNIVNYLCRVCS